MAGKVKEEMKPEGAGDVGGHAGGPGHGAGYGVIIPDNIPSAYHAAYVAAATAARVAAAGTTPPVAGHTPTVAGSSAAGYVTTAPGAGLAEAVRAGSGEMGTASAMGCAGTMVAKAPSFAGYHWQDRAGNWHSFRQAIFFMGLDWSLSRLFCV